MASCLESCFGQFLWRARWETFPSRWCTYLNFCYREESWRVAYSLRCFSTSSTSTCTLQYVLWLWFVHLIYNPTACLLCLSFAFALHVPFRRDSPNKVHLAGKYRDLGFWSFPWTVRLDGTTAATTVSSFPIYSWFKSCLLGSKCMGFGDGNWPCTSSAYAFTFFFVRVSALISSLFTVVRRFGADFMVNQQGVVSTSRGLVGDTTFAVLPTVKPIHTFVITIAFQMVGNRQYAG